MITQTVWATLECDPDFPALVKQYAEESKIRGMPDIAPNWDFYRAADACGVMKTLCAYANSGNLAGFILMLYTVVPHYSRPIATLESFFVAPEYRETGAGLRLLRSAENWARELGCVGMFVSAPTQSKLAEVMERMKGYQETNRAFFKALA